jgi:hypothetical protein
MFLRGDLTKCLVHAVKACAGGKHSCTRCQTWHCVNISGQCHALGALLPKI